MAPLFIVPSENILILWWTEGVEVTIPGFVVQSVDHWTINAFLSERSQASERLLPVHVLSAFVNIHVHFSGIIILFFSKFPDFFKI